MSSEIDEALYSRQIYVLGNQGMLQLSKARVLLVGVGALGVEIAKNIVLAGVGGLTLVDDKTCNLHDLSCQFYINELNVQNKTNRAEASQPELQLLNPYVKVDALKQGLADLSEPDLFALLVQFDCVILTETKYLNLCIKINDFCRTKGIKFLMSDVFGLFGWSFTDLGDAFYVNDLDGEEYSEQFIGKVFSGKGQEVIIETLDQKPHNLETDDLVQFSELVGMNELNGREIKVRVINSFSFGIDFDPSDFTTHKMGGVYRQLKKKATMKFEPLNEQIRSPSLTECDLSEQKFTQSLLSHIALFALHRDFEREANDFDQFMSKAKKLAKEHFEPKFGELDHAKFEKTCRVAYFTRNGRFPPLCAFFGGLVAQEVLKSLTNKFTPIKQWMHLDAIEAFEVKEEELDQLTASYEQMRRGDRCDNLRECFGGERTLQKLKDCRLFMVGCGAIGCEMLKNLAMLSVGTGEKGLISITDHDLIEKSNLNRQFLFRQEDIQKPKSLSALKAIHKINPDVKIKAYEKKVCPQTENELFSDDFFQSQDLCVNALDNVEARRYMDTRCVTNQKPLIETGTLGPKGHVQTILPHLTESYNSQRDPADTGIPYCTLKSFPSNIEHCIQWSRDKFESGFNLKPNAFQKFLKSNTDLKALVESLKSNENLVVDGVHQFAKMARNFCCSWEDCVLLARVKFEKYFSNKAKDLLHNYPLESLTSDGSPFWKLPRRPPQPLSFDPSEQSHLDFIRSFARLAAQIFDVKVDSNVLNDQTEICRILEDRKSQVPLWTPKKKHIETDETKQKEQIELEKVKETKEVNTNSELASIIEKFLKKVSQIDQIKLNVIEFEKDVDSNGHVDLICSSSNLRARMYSIEPTEKLLVKKIAGKIVPAIATTTSCIAGYAAIELVKIVQGGWKLNDFRNLFLNLAISLFILSEPGECIKSKVAEGCFVSLWDKWTIQGSKTFTLKNFVDAVKSKYKLTVSGVMLGSKPIYLPAMPGHAKRLAESMMKLSRASASDRYLDLHVTYAECDSSENRDQNNLCPPIRYFLY